MTTMGTTTGTTARRRDGVHLGLWAVQWLLALFLVGGGLWKLATPVEQVAEAFAWAGQVPPALLRTSAVLDVLGGVGVLVPSLTRIRPSLTVVAALGVAALMASAAAFHLSRGEAADTPLNAAVAALALVVAWGRRYRAPIAPRAR